DVLCLSGLDHDLVSHNDLAGQAYVHLARIAKIDGVSHDDLPTQAIAVPLAVPHNGTEFGPFQVLKERSSRDPEAKQVYRYQKYISDYKMLPPSAKDETESPYSAGFQEHLRDIVSVQKEKLRNILQSYKPERLANGS
uniref:Uncharacterized protein n=1 Tax=Plectus sambesii TaxID=2011161 RepID=A0A914XF80_9BILA